MKAKEFNANLQKIKYDKSVVTLIYLEYAPGVRLHVARRFNGEVDADDVTHEVYLKLMETDWSEFEPITSPAAWLNAIADRFALDLLRSSNFECPLEKLEDTEYPFSPDDLMIAQDVKTALSFLSKRSAEIIYLNRYEGYTLKDIAKILKLKEINVRVIASRAYKKLKKICSKMNIYFV